MNEREFHILYAKYTNYADNLSDEPLTMVERFLLERELEHRNAPPNALVQMAQARQKNPLLKQNIAQRFVTG